MPTVIIVSTALVAVLITETLLSSGDPFATYTLLPSGVTVIPNGESPTGIVATTWLVTVLIKKHCWNRCSQYKF